MLQTLSCVVYWDMDQFTCHHDQAGSHFPLSFQQWVCFFSHYLPFVCLHHNRWQLCRVRRMVTELSFQIFKVRKDCFHPQKKKNCDMQISPKCRIDNLRLFSFVLPLYLSFTLEAWAVTRSFEERCFGAVKKPDVALIGLLTVLMLAELH